MVADRKAASEPLFVQMWRCQDVRRGMLSPVICRILPEADGQIDTQESQAILTQINSLDLPAEDKAFLFEEYGRPLDIQVLINAEDSPEHGAEVYAASVLMVDPPSASERIYLDALARALGLEDGLVQQIHATVAANRSA